MCPGLQGGEGGLGKKWRSSLTCQGTLREWEVGTLAFLAPPKATPRPRTPRLLRSWIPAQPRPLMGFPDFVPSRVPRAVPPLPASTLPLCHLSRPSACPASSLRLLSTALSPPASRGRGPTW